MWYVTSEDATPIASSKYIDPWAKITVEQTFVNTSNDLTSRTKSICSNFPTYQHQLFLILKPPFLQRHLSLRKHEPLVSLYPKPAAVSYQLWFSVLIMYLNDNISWRISQNRTSVKYMTYLILDIRFSQVLVLLRSKSTKPCRSFYIKRRSFNCVLY